MIYRLEGEVPSKKNSKLWTRGRKLVPSNEYSAWHKGAMDSLLVQGIPKEPIHRCAISVCLYHINARTKDSDNALSSILDLLEDAHIIQTDRWQCVNPISVEAAYTDSDAPYCTIEVTPIDAEWPRPPHYHYRSPVGRVPKDSGIKPRRTTRTRDRGRRG